MSKDTKDVMSTATRRQRLLLMPSPPQTLASRTRKYGRLIRFVVTFPLLGQRPKDRLPDVGLLLASIKPGIHIVFVSVLNLDVDDNFGGTV